MTDYRIARAKEDYAISAEFLGKAADEIMFPTVVAVRDGRIVGAVATHNRDDMVVAGPLRVDESIPNKAVLALKLSEEYERVMAALEVREFLFSVYRDNERYLRALERLPIERVDENESMIWFRRQPERG